MSETRMSTFCTMSLKVNLTWRRYQVEHTRSSSGDEIANVNCFTTTSYTYYTVQQTRP